VAGRRGVKPHPAIAIEQDSRLGFARLIRELDLDTEPPVSNRVGPPALFSNRGVSWDGCEFQGEAAAVQILPVLGEAPHAAKAMQPLTKF
jgi:hypothetical protein